MKPIQRIAVFIVMLCSSMALWAQTAVPALTAPVMDTAQMMSATARQELNTHLLQYSKTHGSQIMVLTVPAIAPETPFDYATRVMQTWKPGRQDISDGVLLLLVRDERKTHLAVGRGLEGAIPDVYAKRILADVLRPYLQQGQTDAGIYAAVNQIEKLIAGEQLPEAARTDTYGSGQDAGNDWLVLLIVAVFVGGLLKGLFGRKLGSLFTGGALFVVLLILGWSLLLALVVAVVGSVFAFVMGGSHAFTSGGGPRGGGWNNRGGFGGGGCGGGGGFGGGGGGFGGGGASGGW